MISIDSEVFTWNTIDSELTVANKFTSFWVIGIAWEIGTMTDLVEVMPHKYQLQLFK